MNTWDEIDGETQRQLIEWYNVVEEQVDDNDRELLAKLYHDGNFHVSNCAECGEESIYATPTDWGPFQGVTESDNRGMGQLCDDCAGLYIRLKEFAEE